MCVDHENNYVLNCIIIYILQFLLYCHRIVPIATQRTKPYHFRFMSCAGRTPQRWDWLRLWENKHT